MKKILVTLLVVAASLIGSPRASAQAPTDLSFLTNRATLASWGMRQVDEIQVDLFSVASGSPDTGIQPVTKRFPYKGPASLSAMAKSLKGQVLTASTPIPNSSAMVTIWLNNTLPDGNKQNLLVGGASGKPEFDGTNWRLPKDASEPSIYLVGTVFIPARGVTRAWIVETNADGWALKKSLSVWYGQGFYFESSLSGEGVLCLEFGGKGDETTQWVYDLHGSGVRMPLPAIIAAVSIRDSDDVRDYGDNTNSISHWVYTYQPSDSSLTYGIVPLQIANYTTNTTAQIWVGSQVGYAQHFAVTKLAPPGSNMPDSNFTLDVPSGQNYVTFTFTPGLYHLVPLGINVHADWWKILDVGYAGGKGKAPLQ